MAGKGGSLVSERWSTLDQIKAALARYEQRIPGWNRPAAYAVGLANEHGTYFPTVNIGRQLCDAAESSPEEYNLPAAVLAAMCGYGAGTWTYVLTVEQLRKAVARLAPAEAWTGSDHPNLAAWREILHEVRARPLEDQTIVAVFIGHPDPQPRDEYQQELVKRISERHG